MSTLRAFDDANPDISPEAMVKHGAIVATVYFRGHPGGYQPADAARVKALRDVGLGVWPNWESTADFFRTCTITQAKAAGIEARRILPQLGFPDDGSTSVPASFDYQVAVPDFKGRLDRLSAFQDGLDPDRFMATSYGQTSLIRYFAANGFGRTGHWLMASTWGQAYRPDAEHVAIVQSHQQINGEWWPKDENGQPIYTQPYWLDTPVPGTDVNTVTQPDRLAAWWPDGSPYAGGGDMPLTDAEIEKIAAAVAPAVWKHRLSSQNEDWTAGTWLTVAREAAHNAATALTAPGGGVVARVAALQKAVAAQAATVDPGAFAAAVLDKFRALLGGNS